MTLYGAIAANRFGLGAKPGEIETASTDPKGWLKAQLSKEAPVLRFAQLKGGAELAKMIAERAQMLRQVQGRGRNQTPDQTLDADAIRAFLAEARSTYLREMAARFVQGFATEQPFRERLVRFWSNHFVVSIAKPQCVPLVGAFEREAIRPHVTGRFVDMLLAVERHPAMQVYLDNAQSIGPNSMAGRLVNRGLNENLGREILELHTLGVDGGYTQADVLALAKMLTGWSIDGTEGARGPLRRLLTSAFAGEPGVDGFRFYGPRHEPGAKTLLGKTYPEGYDGGVQALSWLAQQPATARHVATKLARHFIGDTPPEGSVERIAKAFQGSGGDLRVVSAAIVDEEAAWNAAPAKFRTPVEFVTAAMRAAGGGRMTMLDERTIVPLVQSVRAMGESPFGAPSPKGWPDTAEAWTGSDSILERVEWSNAAAQRVGAGVNPLSLADEALGPLASAATRTAITRAASPVQGLALLLASPEFQRR